MRKPGFSGAGVQVDAQVGTRRRWARSLRVLVGTWAALLVSGSLVVAFPQVAAGADVADGEITSSVPVDGRWGVPYSHTFTASAPGATWSITSGTLPAGLELDATSGLLSGTPTAAGAGGPVTVEADWGPERSTAIAAGGLHACGLTGSGAVECWGHDGAGQAADQDGPFTAIAAGDHHTCGLTGSGALECWGRNGDGQAADRDGPFTAMAAGDLHTCGLTVSGAVECWGDDTWQQAADRDGPFTAIAAGSAHTCGLAGSGAAECWGSDTFGQDADRDGPFTAITAGALHTCGLTGSGAAVCWGANSDGQAADREGPFTAIAAGAYHTCGLTVSGAVECWGDDRDGQSDPSDPPSVTATQSFTIDVAPADATVTVTGWDQVYDGEPKPVSVATEPEGLATAVTYDGSPVPPTDAGTYPVVVELDDPDHVAEPVTGTLTVAPAEQTIEFAVPTPEVVVGDVVELSATAGSGSTVSFTAAGPCSVAGVELTALGVGECVVTATQDGDANWAAAPPVQHQVQIVGIPSSVTVTGWDQVYDGEPKPVSVATEPEGLATSVTYDGSPVPPTDAGTYRVLVELDDADHAAEPVTGTLTVAPVVSGVRLAGPDGPTVVGQEATFTATVSTPTLTPVGDVTFETDRGDRVEVALVDGTASWTVTDLSVGGVEVTATYAGTPDILGSTSPAVDHLVTAPLMISGLPSTVQVGDVVEVQVEGFHPGETITFTLHSEPVQVGRVDADPSGSATLTFTVPNLPDGDHDLIATGSTSLLEVAATTTISTPQGPPAPTEPTTAPTTEALPVTGSAIATAKSVALLSLLAGFAAIRLTRPRASTRT